MGANRALKLAFKYPELFPWVIKTPLAKRNQAFACRMALSGDSAPLVWRMVKYSMPNTTNRSRTLLQSPFGRCERTSAIRTASWIINGFEYLTAGDRYGT